MSAYQGDCVIQMIVKCRFMGDNQVTSLGNCLFEYVHRGKHGGYNTRDWCFRITRFKYIHRLPGPGYFGFLLDPLNDLCCRRSLLLRDRQWRTEG